MANGHTIPLTSDFARERAIALIRRAPNGYVCSLQEPKRTQEQNDRMWAMLTDISVAMPGGRRHTPDEWDFWLKDAASILRSNGTTTHAEKVEAVRLALATDQKAGS